MAFSFECIAITHIGKRRKNNEDNFFIGELLSSEEQAAMSLSHNMLIQKILDVDGTSNRIFAVSDGMGGHKHGEVASFMVVDALNDFTNRYTGKASRKRKDKFDFIEAFQDAISQTNARILEYALENNARDDMGATLSGLIIFSDEVAPFNIGDSSTFLYENCTLCKLTTDDNELSMLGGDAGGLKIDLYGKRLTKYFGLPKSSGVLTATISPPVDLRSGQLYLVVSDGLSDFLSNDSISKIIERYKDDIGIIANELVEAVFNEDNGGRDNITAVIIKVNNSK